MCGPDELYLVDGAYRGEKTRALWAVYLKSLKTTAADIVQVAPFEPTAVIVIGAP